ncbi:MAG TPA: hypothetical protein VFH51_19820, partial [Myxococcota bacterium]|nr:hypothetical protein [Myxococcota bacterium]
EEALVDLGRGIKGFFDARKAGRGRRQGFPVFKKRGRCKPSFRIRNKKQDVRVLEYSIRLPRLRELAVRESTRKLRRMLRPRAGQGARAKVLFATVTQVADRWHVRINVEAAALHPACQHAPQAHAAPALGYRPRAVHLRRGRHRRWHRAPAQHRPQAPGQKAAESAPRLP